MPYITGGELYKVLKSRRTFDEPTVKFFIAQVIIGLGKLHEKGIMHRDLKLENIMLDTNGYVKIIDFGMAKMLETPNQLAHTVCGTPEYYAPELINEEGYDKTVDWWACGILIYEMLTGVTPFFAQMRNRLYQNIRTGNVNWPANRPCSNEMKNLVQQLLNRDPTTRLGQGEDGYMQILQHPWFSSLDLGALEAMTLPAPFLTSEGANADPNPTFFNSNTDENALQETVLNNRQMNKINANVDLFADFDQRL